jgi:hypothetical protein
MSKPFANPLLKPQPKSSPPLPFAFASKIEEDDCSTSSSYLKTPTEHSFIRELHKIQAQNLTILAQNPEKQKDPSFTPAGSPTGRFPYQRKARSISPPKDPFAITEKTNYFFFPNSPVIPDNSLQGNLPEEEETEDDNDLKQLKAQYLKMIQVAPGLNFKSELFENEENTGDIDEFSEWETSIMKKMQLKNCN